MYQIMTADEAMDLINDGDVIALNSFLGIDIPIELHEALYKIPEDRFAEAPHRYIKRGLWCVG